ncbi:DUF5719 family protein [Microbacterium sp. RU33B]|uniref:DUF5719 family protein n=1 Tax=Microbacterium sp. RU33B TaxID=1907390 RepID=UPI00095C786E|nr:DUF5719 family protein [Microbacterium sp. RU33B]SIT88862.1 hypothetical protein SAMN05880545_3083 [Microbacterium sp. RU33B]
MSDRRFLRLASTSARLLIGTVVSVAAVVAVVTAVSLPWPVVERAPLSIQATPEPGDTIAVCDGPLLALGRQSQAAAELSLAASATVTAGVAEGASAATESRLESPNVTNADPVPVFTAAPEDGVRSDVAASSSASVRSDDLAGFAASACRPPLLESWLVGGAGTTGAADLVVLSNPGDVPAAVQLTLFGAQGESTPAGGSIVIAPRTQRVLPLAGIAFGEDSPVIRVTATGGPVQASLQTSITRTLVPGGVDQSGALAAPTRTVVITGIDAAARAETDDATSLLRLLSPSADTTASVTVIPVGSTTPIGEPSTIPLTAGSPVEVDLGLRDAGRYTVVVAADQPVVAAAWQATGLGEGDDFAWYTPSDEIAVPTLFATPAGAPPRVTLANTADVDAAVRIATTDGSFSTEVAVAAGSSVDVPLPSRGVYLLDPGATTVRAAVSFASAGALAGFPVWPADAAAQAITVYP